MWILPRQALMELAPRRRFQTGGCPGGRRFAGGATGLANQFSVQVIVNSPAPPLVFAGGRGRKHGRLPRPRRDPVEVIPRRQQPGGVHVRLIRPLCAKFFCRDRARKDERVARAGHRHIQQPHFLAQRLLLLPLPREPVRQAGITPAVLRRLDLRRKPVFFIQDDFRAQVGKVERLARGPPPPPPEIPAPCSDECSSAPRNRRRPPARRPARFPPPAAPR